MKKSLLVLGFCSCFVFGSKAYIVQGKATLVSQTPTTITITCNPSITNCYEVNMVEMTATIFWFAVPGGETVPITGEPIQNTSGDWEITTQ